MKWLLTNVHLLIGVVSERIREAVKNSSAPMMMLFPGLLMCS